MQVLTHTHRFLLTVSLVILALAAMVGLGNGDPVKAVSFSFTGLDNRTVRLSDYQGKWVLVNFWAPWCPLCKIQVPSLNTLNQRTDTRVIGIALDYGADEGAIRKAIQVANMRFDAFVAGGSRRDPASAQRQVGPVDFFPTSYLYDPDGEIVMFIPGQLRLPRVLAFMENWHAEHGPAKSPVLAARTDRLAAFLKQKYGERGSQAFADWKRMADGALSLPPAERLARVNDFYNRRTQAGQDAQIWGREDHWATPGELLGTGRGDGEDFAIAKYFTLVALNMAPEQMRMVYVRPRTEGKPAAQVHMVLAWYETPGQEPLILDNREPAILSAARRTDLKPVFSFNSLGVWEETANAAAAGEASRLAIWEDALRRARAEGFE